MRVNEHAAKNQYAAYALGAGRAERDGEYGKAAELWRRAANAPCNASKQRWAQRRAA
ncbi:ANR family transcriptional regulator, partial [Salmonella enterica]